MNITITEKESSYIDEKAEYVDDIDMRVYINSGDSFEVNSFQMVQLFSMILMLRPEVNWAGNRELQDHDRDWVRVETEWSSKQLNLKRQ